MVQFPWQTIVVYHFWPMARSFSLLSMTLLMQSSDTRWPNPLIRHRVWTTCCVSRWPTVLRWPLSLSLPGQWRAYFHFCRWSLQSHIIWQPMIESIDSPSGLNYLLCSTLSNQQFYDDYCAYHNQANSAFLTGRWSLLNATHLTSNDRDSIESGILSNPFPGKPKETPVLQSLASKPSHSKVYIPKLKTARSYKIALIMKISSL